MAAAVYLAALKSPKSSELPVVSICTYSITLLGALPPANNPLVLSDATHIARRPLADNKSPKSAALPVVAIVIYCI